MAHRVIVIHSTEDAELHRDLQLHLSAAKRAGLVVLHSTTDFADDVAMASAIDEADIELVLLTPALVNSSQWTGVALQQAKATAERLGIPVVPIVLQRCAWEQSWLGQRAPLPRNGPPICERKDGAAAGWVEVAANLQHLFTARAPRLRQVLPLQGKEAAADTRTATVPGDLSAVPDAYRLLEQYHEALLRLVDAAARTTERLLGPLQKSSWTPGELHHPGRRSSSSVTASRDHMPLKHVSYILASTPSLQTGGGRVILVHDGDGAPDAPANGDRERRPAARSTLSVSAVFVVHQRKETIPLPPWEDADAAIAAAQGYSPRDWEDGGAHVAETGNTTFRFGGFSQDTAHILASPSPEAWLARIRTLVAEVKGSSSPPE